MEKLTQKNIYLQNFTVPNKKKMRMLQSRLEDILSSAIERNLVEPKNANEMLRNMFWQGLKPALKDISGYKFEKITDFDQLRVELRKLEQDHFHPQSVTTIISKVTNTDKNELKEMKTMIQSLTNTVKQLENKVNSNQTGNQAFSANRGRGKNTRGNYSGYSQNYNNTNIPNRETHYNNTGQGFDRNTTSAQRQRQGANFNRRPQNYPRQDEYNYSAPQQRTDFNNRQDNRDSYQAQNQPEQQTEGDNFNRGPLCFRCRQYGHFQWQCPVRMDHSRKYLN
ncbi:MAG: hypothetical protein N0C90_18285 [Candidatus Thiodiazotropha endolucinida]|nr:hypothetical protein [Candidatus Thiodiazotropha taylori]MCW4263305.1 hypothetical protein [Candidatus Thiodiazotropha endolucinida]